MRVQPVPYVYRTDDRDHRWRDEAGERSERRQSGQQDRRARHANHPWLAADFGAHLLGQATPASVPATPATVARAYRQPEARTPLRPRMVKTA
jgi:hypothetical protein